MKTSQKSSEAKKKSNKKLIKKGKSLIDLLRDRVRPRDWNRQRRGEWMERGCSTEPTAQDWLQLLRNKRRGWRDTNSLRRRRGIGATYAAGCGLNDVQIGHDRGQKSAATGSVGAAEGMGGGV